jgi:hypothetical protein
MGGATGSLGGRLGAAPRLRAALSSAPSIRVIDKPGAAPALSRARAGQAAGVLERVHALPSARSPFIETDATRGSLDALAAENNPALKAFQLKHNVKLGLKDVGNWDETGLDLCAFASMDYLFLKFSGNEVAVPFEQSPHITIVVGLRQDDPYPRHQGLRERAAEPGARAAARPAERGRGARKHSRDGLIVGGEEWEAWQADKEETAAKAVTKKTATALAFWARHRAAVRAIEEKLEDGVEVEDLNVSELKALIISRTGRTAKTAKGGKAALLIEAASAMSRESCIPPTPPRPPQDENDGSAVCECGTAADADLEPDEEGYSWCGHCGGRLLE